MSAKANRPTDDSRGTWRRAFLLGLVLTGANALKPLHMDDPYYYAVAEQICRRPADPYGFSFFWYQWPHPVADEMINPVLPYWLAVGMWLGGTAPVLCKLWLLPVLLLWTRAVLALGNRFAPGLERPLALMVVFGPVFLPGCNLMADVPAQALAASAAALALASYDRRRLSWSIGAGLLAALSLQTKYTTFAVPVWLLWEAWRQRQWRLGAVTVAVAAAVFVSWEACTTAMYGEGMLLGQLRHREFPDRVGLAVAIPTLVGGSVPFLGVASLAALGLPWPVTALAATTLTGMFAAHGFVGLSAAWFTSVGAVVVLLVVVAVIRIHRAERPIADSRALWGSASVSLSLWFLLELGQYLAAAPFPATRRLMGMTLVASLLVGRAVALGLPAAGRRRIVAFVPAVVMAVVLGVLVEGVDHADARAQMFTAREAVRVIRQKQSTGTIWFLGHWGFQFYGERAGMRPVIPDRSVLEAGDVLVFPGRITMQEIHLWDVKEFAPVGVVHVDDLRLTTIPDYYAGTLPLVRLGYRRQEVMIFAVTGSVRARTSWSVDRLVHFAKTRPRGTAAAAVPALAERLASAAPPQQVEILDAFIRLGPLAREAAYDIEKLAQSPEEVVRAAVQRALAALGPTPRP